MLALENIWLILVALTLLIARAPGQERHPLGNELPEPTS